MPGYESQSEIGSVFRSSDDPAWLAREDSIQALLKSTPFTPQRSGSVHAAIPENFQRATFRESPRARHPLTRVAAPASLPARGDSLTLVASIAEPCRARQSGGILQVADSVRGIRRQVRCSPLPVGTYQLKYFSRYLACF
jgi:hypothetical protein